MEVAEILVTVMNWGVIMPASYLLFRTSQLYREFRKDIWCFALAGFALILASVILRPISVHTGIQWLMQTGGIMAATGGLSLAFLFVSLYRSLRASLEAPPVERPEMLREDMATADIYCDLTNELVIRVTPVVGMKRVKSTIKKHVELNPFFRGCKVMEDGRLDVKGTIKALEKINGKRGMPGIFRGFANINLELLRLYSITVSEADAREVFEKAFAASTRRYGETVYKMGMPLILFWEILGPPIRKCNKKTIFDVQHRLKEAAAYDSALQAVNVEDSGIIRLDLLYEVLADVPGEEWRKITIPTLASVMNKCYPALKQDLDEELDALLSESVLGIIGRYPALRKYGLLDAIPPMVSTPEIFQMLRGGQSYLVEASNPKIAFELFDKLQKFGLPGLCITSSLPEEIRRKHGVKAEVVWLTKQETEKSISPSDLDLLRDKIYKFVSKSRGGVILLDRVEYIILVNGFDKTIMFLHDVRDLIAIKKASLIVLVSPAAVGEKQLAMLETGMEVARKASD